MGEKRKRRRTFTIPTGTLRINLPKHLLITLTRPLKRHAQPIFINLIIMIDKYLRPLHTPLIISLRPTLMRMPRQIHIQRRDRHLSRILRHDLKKAVVLLQQALHGLRHRRAVQPIDVVHLLHKRALSDHRTGQVHAEYRRVVPIPAHDFSYGKPLARHQARVANDFISTVDRADEAPIKDCGLEEVTDVAGTGRCAVEDIGNVLSDT